MKLKLPTRFVSTPPASDRSLDYLIGLRGILVIQAFLFVFFQTFLPTTVADSKNATGPLYQVILRKTLSVLFWNESLIYSFIILLSARTLCLPFITNPHRTICASSIFRRGIRLWIPTFVAFSISAAIFSTASTTYIDDFLHRTKNASTIAPTQFTSFLTYFNSLFELFWVTKHYSSQAANQAFPSNTLWIVSVLFQQSYTVYMTMITIPYTRAPWRVKALLTFIITAWWVQSWAWYSITGLLIADAVHNMRFQYKSQQTFSLRKFKIGMWPVYCTLIVAGWVLQYLFIAWRPDYRNQELKGHTGLYNSGGLNEGNDLNEPQARDDNFLIIMGVMLVVETYDILQRLLRTRVLVALGKRSFSAFLVQPILIYTAGIRLYNRCHAVNMKHELATFVCFVVCVPLVGVASEIFYRVVDVPAVIIARETWAWVRK